MWKATAVLFVALGIISILIFILSWSVYLIVSVHILFLNLTSL
jgi:hypothetical protein